MSGKDRTGFMDGIAKTFAIMAEANEGKYPTHKELQSNDRIRQQFTSILRIVLLKSGNLEITEMNTNAKGYKVRKEALLGMDIENVFRACWFVSYNIQLMINPL